MACLNLRSLVLLEIYFLHSCPINLILIIIFVLLSILLVFSEIICSLLTYLTEIHFYTDQSFDWPTQKHLCAISKDQSLIKLHL